MTEVRRASATLILWRRMHAGIILGWDVIAFRWVSLRLYLLALRFTSFILTSRAAGLFINSLFFKQGRRGELERGFISNLILIAQCPPTQGCFSPSLLFQRTDVLCAISLYVALHPGEERDTGLSSLFGPIFLGSSHSTAATP